MAREDPFSATHPTDRLVGDSPPLQALRAQIHHLAAFDTVGSALVPTLLLQGETGTGKGLLARVIHDSGPRAHGPFIDVNCAAIPETLLEVELFGFEAGTFTDAKRPKPGLLESASRGTLFLDEIDALPLPLQAKLLNAIEEKRARRLGATESRPLDVKLIAATPVDLSMRVAEGRFRPDLYHRLAVVILEIPPLRDRGEDVLILAQHFLRHYAQGHARLPKRLTEDAEAWLREYNWPGNVRELSHLMERLMLLRTEAIVSAPTLEELCLPRPSLDVRAAVPPVREHAEPVDEPARIRQALSQTGYNVVRAAHLLGISRGALRYRMRQYAIGRPRLQLSSPLAAEETRERAARDSTIPASHHQRGQGKEPQLVGKGGEAEAWEQKPVAMLAIDVAWPEVTDLNTSHAEPWTVATRWQQTIAAKVQGFGGLLVQYAPSPLTAVFGLPQTLEQLPQRAVQVALAIRHQITEEGALDGKQPCPAVRMAVHVGQVLADVQARDPTARLLPLGETLSLPLRLLGHAAPGDILLSPQVGRLVEGWFELQRREGPAGAGSTDGVGAYAVVGVGPRRSALEVYGKRPLSRFVGRERELATLRDLAAQVDKGRGQVVGIIGEPGAGKSRLCYEMTQVQRTQDWRILESSPVAYGKEIPYLPVIDLLKAYFQVYTRDEGPALRDKVMGKLQTLDESLGPTLPALLALLDAPVEDPQWQALDPPQRRQRILDACKRLWLRESQVQPVLLVVENLHWIDSETQACLDSMVDSLPTARILLVVNYRPEYHHAWSSKTSYTQLRLDPLPPQSAEALLRDLLGEEAGLEQLKQRLIDRTEGNPFFLEESVRALVETRALVGELGAYRLAQALPTIQVPATVQSVLAARIDRLPPEEKRLLQTAAVIGHEAPLPLLHSMADLPEDALHRGLDHLQAAEFLYETRLFPEREYTFKHALSHKVAYDSLLQERRRALHGRIVATIERHYADRLPEHIERLAHHAFRGEAWGKAVAYLRQAGAKASTRSAYREALAYFEQALVALTHLPETRETREQAIDLRFDLRNALFPLAEFGRIDGYLREAERLARTLDDRQRLGWVSAYMASHHLLTGAHTAQLRTLAQSVQAIADTLGDGPLQVAAQYYLLMACYISGDYRETEHLCLRLMQSLQGERTREQYGVAVFPAVLSRAYLAFALAEVGSFDEGDAVGHESIRMAEALDHPYSIIWACLGLAYLNNLKGDLSQAAHLLERAVVQCRDWNLTLRIPFATASLGHVYAWSGRVDDGISWLQQGMTAFESVGNRLFHSLSVMQLAEAYLLADRVEDARACADRAVRLARERGERGHEAWALRLLGEVASHQGRPDVAMAKAHYGAAMTLASELGMRPLQAHCYLALGTLYAKTGQPEQARAALTAAIDLYRAMEMTFWLPQAEAILVQMKAR